MNANTVPIRIRALCWVCERNGLGGYAGYFEESELTPGRWDFYPATRQGRRPAAKTNGLLRRIRSNDPAAGTVNPVRIWQAADDESNRMATMRGRMTYPLKPRCIEGHMLRILTDDDVTDLMAGSVGGKVRLPE